MKKLITLTCLLGAFVLSAKSEIKTVVVSEENKEAAIEIGEGEVGECVFVSFFQKGSHPQYLYRKAHIKIEINSKVIEITPPNDNYQLSVDSKFMLPIVAGPAKVHLVSEGGAQALLSMKISQNSGVNSGNNVTVLPKETENMELILESSDDMVKWEKDVIGDKPKANRKKFYRLRAVKK